MTATADDRVFHFGTAGPSVTSATVPVMTRQAHCGVVSLAGRTVGDLIRLLIPANIFRYLMDRPMSRPFTVESINGRAPYLGGASHMRQSCCGRRLSAYQPTVADAGCDRLDNR